MSWITLVATMRASREEWGHERSEYRGSSHDEAAEREARVGPKG
jgi:hypothetical protein